MEALQLDTESIKEEAQALAQEVTSYRLRLYYMLCCMTSDALNEVLKQSLTGCEQTNVKIQTTSALEYLSEYDPENMDQLRVIDCIYDIMCQIHSTLDRRGEVIYRTFKSFDMLRDLMILETGKEAFRPDEVINKRTILSISANVLEQGQLEDRIKIKMAQWDSQRLSDEQRQLAVQKMWEDSAEFEYAREESRLAEAWVMAKIEEQMPQLQAASEQAYAQAQPENTLVEDGVAMPSMSLDPEDLRAPMQGLDMNVEMDPLMEGVDTVQAPKRSKGLKGAIFGDALWVEGKDYEGAYGQVTLFGVITLKERMFVQSKAEIMSIMTSMPRWGRAIASVTWFTHHDAEIHFW